jgi:PAS domain-containing protein
MIPDKTSREKFDALRSQAEKLLSEKGGISGKAFDGDLLKLIHELETAQIELEMQNEELRLSQQELLESRIQYEELYDFAPVGYLTISKKGLIQKANLTLADMLSMERRYLVNKPLFAHIIVEDQDIFYKHLKELFDSKTQ